MYVLIWRQLPLVDINHKHKEAPFLLTEDYEFLKKCKKRRERASLVIKEQNHAQYWIRNMLLCQQ